MEEIYLDLTFGPDPEVSLEPAAATNNAAAVLSDVANEPFNRNTENLRRFRTRHMSRFRQINFLPIELSQLLISSANGAASPAGTGGERVSEEKSKKCENGNEVMEEDSVTEEKRVVGRKGSFYDCYICMDLSKDPVVTTCGHLYCWSCLYRWLQVSEAKECPVCKGEVSVKTLTPIYGRGKKNNKQGSEEVSDTNKIPARPQARRVARVRSKIQRPGYVGREIINRFMTSRRVRAEQNQSNAEVVATEAAEIDSMVTVVGRPHENVSRVSDVDSADSPPLRRSRLA